MKTYLMTFENKPLLYVFDEDGVISYTMADGDQVTDYLTKVFTEKQKLCNAICAQMDYAMAANQAQMEWLMITQQKSSDALLTYLKDWRNRYAGIGAGLKSKEGNVPAMYNSNHRRTREDALKEINEIQKYS